MRPIWTGAIGFGLVNIPVKLFSATESSNLDLDMLDKKDHSRINFVRVNASTGKEVKWENIVKGFKIDNKYILLEDADFEKANAVKTKLIEIDQFVDISEVNTMYYETPYYLVPEKSGTRPYALLREALLKTKKAGIATFVMRTKEHLALLTAIDDVIVLYRLRFAEELRPYDELTLPAKSSVKAAELKMAVSLISQLSGKLKIEKFKDTYSAQLMKFIKAKAKGKGKQPAAPQMKVVHSKTQDLMEQLKASLGTKRKKAS